VVDILEELAAEREIRTLCARYAQLADDDAYEEWAALFAEDGVIDVEGTRVTGRSELRQWLADMQRAGSMRHLFTNVIVTIDSPTTARATMGMVLLRSREGRWAVFGSPRYEDRLVKEQGAWLFLERKLDLRIPSS
jgi:3-phenylpropionate/cinnamic acid dioxygenase small subunit